MPPHTRNELNQAIFRQRVHKIGGTTRYVNGAIGNDGSRGFQPHKPMKTITAARAISEPWDIIYVFDGVYAETLILDVEHLIIIGETRDGTIIQPAAAADVVDVTADHCELYNLKVVFPTGVGATSALTFNAFKTTLDNVWLHNAGNDGFGFVMSAVQDEQTIHNCVVTGFMNQMNIAGGNRHKIHDNVLTLNGAGGVNIYIDSTTNCQVYNNDLDGGGAGAGIDSFGNVGNVYFHNNIYDHAVGDNAAEDSANNTWRENHYDDCAADVDNDGYGDSPYDVGNPAGTDFDNFPIARANGWKAIHGKSGGGAITYGSKELWDSFEYPSDATLQARWIEGGTAGNPTRSATSYYGQYAMQVVVVGPGTGLIYRSFTARNMKSLANITLAARSNNAGDTLRFTIYDSSGNYNYWTQTCTLADTWYNFEVAIHSARTGGSATPVDLEDIVEIRLAELVAGSTYLFDLITFEGLVSTDIEEISYGDAVHVDDGGTDSTDYPYGTPTHPTSSPANGVIIAAARNLHMIHVQGLHAVDYSIAGYEFLGTTGPIAFSLITGAAGIDNTNCTFEKCIITGLLNGISYFENDCILYNITGGLDGFIRNCDLGGTIVLADPSLTYIDFNKVSTQQGPITIDCTNIGAGDQVRFHEFGGTMTLTDLDNATALIRIYSSQGANIIVANSCGAGTIEIFGNCNVNVVAGTAATVVQKTLNFETRPTHIHDSLGTALANNDWMSYTNDGGSLWNTMIANYLRAYNTGLLTAGECVSVARYIYPRYIVAEVTMQVVDGYDPVDGERCQSYIELYTDATHWIKFGPYRDESAGINSRGFVQSQGGTETVDATDVDDLEHTYKIEVENTLLFFYIDGDVVDVREFSIDSGYDEFEVRLGAGTEVDADVMDIHFTEFGIHTLDRRKEQIWEKLNTELQSTWDTIDFIFDQVNAILVTTEHGGSLTTDGTEQDTYINDAPAGVYKPLVVRFDLSNQAAPDTLIIREKYRNVDGGGYDTLDEEPLTGIRDPTSVSVHLEPTRFGACITVELTAGGNFDLSWTVFEDK